MGLHRAWVWAEVSGLLRLLEEYKMQLVCGLLVLVLGRGNASNTSTK